MVDRRLSGPEATGAAALVEPGWRALAVPVEAAPPGLAVGDRVEAYAPAPRWQPGRRRARRDDPAPAGWPATRGSIAVDDRSVTVSVSGADAAGVAGAVLDGALTLALVAPG